MNRQELFHGESHLNSVSRADRGYRGASILYFPHFHVTPGLTVTSDPYYLNKTYDSIKNN